MWKFLKMTVVEDVTTTEEILVEDVKAEDAKEVLLQEEKVVLEAKERQEKVVSVAKEAVLQEEKVLLKEHQDVLRALVTRLDQEDQEETNSLLLIFL